VFVDPVGTGYSRAANPTLQKRFNGLQGDIESVGEFIRLFLTPMSVGIRRCSWRAKVTGLRAPPAWLAT
jgi:hypothetical protein